MLDVQGEFGFVDMRCLKPMRIRGNGPRLSVPDRDRRIVEQRKLGISIKRIAADVRCSQDVARGVLARDWPDGLPKAKTSAPKNDPRPEAESLDLPDAGNEPLAKLGVHFWDIAEFGQCKFIVARDPDDKLARFCGEATAARGCSWCANHLAVVGQPRFKAEAA